MEIITTHLNADFDGMASMVAARKLYPEALLVFSGSQEKNLRKFLLQSAIGCDFQRLKNIDLSQVSRLIIVDTRQPSRIGNFQACLESPDVDIHLYDHHPDAPGDIKGSVEVVRSVGATATVFVEIFQERGVELTPEEATIMAMAEYEDTGSFTFNTTTPADLSAMSWLLAAGANLHVVTQYISQELTVEEVGLLHALIRSATTYTINGIDIVVAKITVPHYVDEFSLIVRRFVEMENHNVLFAVAAMGERIYLIARSRIPEVNVGLVTMEFNGGGHASAASATISNMTLVEAEENLIRYLHKHVHPRRIARELMSAPIISVAPDVAISEANDLMTRYSITVLPVMADKTEIQGLISRREAGKSLFHNLGKLPVSEFMTTEFASLAPGATLAEIQELIIEHRQRFIPVVDRGRPLGVITRTDLFNLLVNDPAYMPGLRVTDGHPSVERNRNLANVLAQAVSREMMVLLRTIGETARDLNYTVYAVGGFVRDLLLHQVNLDLDVVIEGDGIVFARQLARILKGKVRTHAKFNTAVVKLADGFKIDIATARMEYYEYPAAMPVVELSSIKLDLFRRDFTINAMAVHLNPDNFGILVDFFNSQNDLKDRRIRILHNLSFVEDPTRIFRAIRLEKRMGFAMGSLTERQIKNAVRMNLFDRSLGRRYFQELKLILSERNPLPAIYRMNEFGLLQFLHRSLRIDERLRHILEDSHRAVAWYKLLYLEESCRPWLVYMMSLLARMQTRAQVVFFRRFEVPDRYAQAMIRERARARKAVRVLERRVRMRNSEVFRLLDGLSVEGLLYVMTLCRKKEGKKAVSAYVTRLRYVSCRLTGADLKKLGYEPGPQFQEMLACLLAANLDEEIASREAEKALLAEKFPLMTD